MKRRTGPEAPKARRMASRARHEAPKARPAAPKARRAAKAPGSARALDRLRRICLALPEATEKLAWGEPTFRVRGKLFAQLDDHHHGADHFAVWLAAPLGAQEMLVYADPARYFVPPYVGPRGWVGVRLDGVVDWAAVTRLARDAYLQVAPRRLAAAVTPSR
jgi:hypothetical protein